MDDPLVAVVCVSLVHAFVGFTQLIWLVRIAGLIQRVRHQTVGPMARGGTVYTMLGKAPQHRRLDAEEKEKLARWLGVPVASLSDFIIAEKLPDRDDQT